MATFYPLTYGWSNIGGSVGTANTLQVVDNTLNSSKANISLPGKNYLGYGQAVDQTLLNMTEHWASSAASATGPSNPVMGQIWFDVGVNGPALRYYTTNDGGIANAWNSILTAGQVTLDSLVDVDVSTTAPVIGQSLSWNGTKWVPLNASAYASGTAPTSPTTGAQWFDTGRNSLMVYDGANWIDSGSTVKTGPTGSEPTPATIGDQYYDTTKKALVIWNGTAWTGVSGSVGTTAPTPASTGDQWFDTGRNSLMVYDGANWIDAGSTVKTGPTGSEPTPATTGDQYYNTTLGALTTYNGTAWKQVGVVPVVTFSTVTPPVITAAAGDEYYVTSNGLFSGARTQHWIHDGTQWVQVGLEDNTIVDASPTGGASNDF